MSPRGSKRTFGNTWWTYQLIALAESLSTGTRASSARTYARQGKVLAWRLSPGRLVAEVQGKEPWPYEVAIALPTWPADVVDKLAGWLRTDRAVALQIAAGDLPEAFEACVKGLGATLFPPKKPGYAGQPPLSFDCTCLDFSNACKHGLATINALSEAMDRQPALLLRWRGLPEELWLTADESPRDPDTEGPVGFYVAGHPLAADWLPPPSGDPQALLRTLGPLPLKAGKDPLDVPLAEAYDLLAREAGSWLERLSYSEAATSTGPA